MAKKATTEETAKESLDNAITSLENLRDELKVLSASLGDDDGEGKPEKGKAGKHSKDLVAQLKDLDEEELAYVGEELGLGKAKKLAKSSKKELTALILNSKTSSSRIEKAIVALLEEYEDEEEEEE